MTQQTTAAQRALPLGVQAALAAGAMAALTLFGACDNSASPTPDPKVCECPPGTTHKAGEKCCDGENCACEEEHQPILCECPDKIHGNAPCDCNGEDCDCKQKFYTLNYGMTLEDQTGGSITSAHINLVNSSLDAAKTYEGSLIDDVTSAHDIKIIITSGASYSRNGDDFMIGIDNLVDLDHINAILGAFLYQVISFNNFNSNIYLASGNGNAKVTDTMLAWHSPQG
jgi:hypothetical protein